ncbi:MAG: hypothetical protein KBD26_04200 [Candidatus Pacebacteria bacterium]|nr:hypothetical protein [Candidatus Paceibacterota bacterium]
MLDLQTIIHYSLHFLAPGIIAFIFFKSFWKKAWLIMLATILVDLDHILASPVFEADRCSIGFHPLHSVYAIVIYFLILFIPNKYVKVVGAGLLFHMITDFQDCLWMGIF